MKNFAINLQLFGEDDFSDVVIEETATPSAEIEQQPEVTTETPTEEPKQETTEPLNYDNFLDELGAKIKVNHQNERPQSIDDVITNYQKGRNYDKLQEKLNSLQADPRLGNYDKVQQLAELYGMSDADMLDALYNQYYESTAEKQGLTPEQIRKDHELRQKEQSIKQKEETAAKANASTQMYDNFLNMFPDVKSEDIKPETWQRVEQGVDLTIAYIEQRNHDLEMENKILKQNSANAKKAPVGSVTAHGTQEIVDKDFIGFDD